MDSLAKRITHRREELGLMPVDLADITGLSITAILKWELGTTQNLKHENLFLLADALNVYPRWLALGDGPKIASTSREAYRLALTKRDRAGDDRARRAWERIAASFAKAATVAALAILPALTPAPADARPVVSDRLTNCVLCQLLRRWLLALALGALAACTTIDEHTAPPADWPQLTIHEHRVPHAEMRDQCARFTNWLSSPEACAVIRFELLRCDIYFSADFPPMQAVVAHEYQHCAGYDHPGDPVLANAWKLHKFGLAGKAIAESVR